MSFNLLTPESDLHVTSPCNINTLPSRQVMRIGKCISYLLMYMYKEMYCSQKGVNWELQSYKSVACKHRTTCPA